MRATRSCGESDMQKMKRMKIFFLVLALVVMFSQWALASEKIFQVTVPGCGT
jgi:hypothetical protein